MRKFLSLLLHLPVWLASLQLPPSPPSRAGPIPQQAHPPAGALCAGWQFGDCRALWAGDVQVLGQNVIVENKPGGAGSIAMVEARTRKDGYTIILLGHVGTLAVNPACSAPSCRTIR